MILRTCFLIVFVATLAARSSAQEPARAAPSSEMEGVRQAVELLNKTMVEQKQAINDLTVAVTDHRSAIGNLNKTVASQQERATWLRLELPDWYYLSQILMPFVAVGAVLYAARQYAITRRQLALVRVSELRSLIETKEVRDARFNVMTKISQIVKRDNKNRWWEDEGLHGNAAQLCSAYDHLGSALKYFPSSEITRFFLQRWGETAIRAHAILQTFLDFRRKDAPETYAGFTWFSYKAKDLHPAVAARAAAMWPHVKAEGEGGDPTAAPASPQPSVGTPDDK